MINKFMWISPIVERTKQAWKMKFVLGLAVLVNLFLIASLILIHEFNVLGLSEYAFASVLVCMILYAYPCWAIKCPECKTRWLWWAVSTLHSQQWLRWFVAQEECPSCKESFINEL